LFSIVWAGSTDPAARDAIAQWTASKIWPDKPGKQFGQNVVCMGVMQGNMPAGAVVFHDYEPDAQIIELSSAAINKRWLTRQVLKEMFDYPFVTLGLQMVVTRVSANDRQKHLHRIFHSYGFKSQVIPRLFGRHEDGILFRLTDDDWRSSKFNQ
jgi:RimJ/RimL family protein N-acetyltransferase